MNIIEINKTPPTLDNDMISGRLSLTLKDLSVAVADVDGVVVEDEVDVVAVELAGVDVAVVAVEDAGTVVALVGADVVVLVAVVVVGTTVVEENNKPEDIKRLNDNNDLKAEKKIKIDEDSAPAAKMSFSVSSDSMQFMTLCETLEAIENTTKRLVINDILTNFFIKLINESQKDLLPSVYLSLNQIAPTFEGIELGIGETVLVKAVSAVTGRSISAIRNDVKELGDLGKVAQSSKSSQKMMYTPKSLSIHTVFKTFRDIALITGKDSVTKKVDKIRSLLVACQGCEVKYLIRILEGKLRIGLAERSILTSLGTAFIKAKNPKASPEEIDEGVETLKSVFNEIPSYDQIIPALFDYGVNKLSERCHMTPGIPLKPMLAHPTKSLTEVLDRFEGKPFTCEYKYDGERAQVHRLADGSIKIFSRNSEDMTDKYPDIMEHIPEIITDGAQSFVIDAEVVAFDRLKNSILPFQVLSTRKRKDVNTANIQVQVSLYAFDLLFLNGKSLLTTTFRERRDLLHQNFRVVEGKFAFAKYMDAQTTEDIQYFLDDSVKENCEGLMVKTLVEESSYEPSKRSRNWLKVKKDYVSGIGDSVDLVVIGAYHGKGKRVGNYGGFLLACYDDQNEEYQTICKIGTGFSDSDLGEHTTFLNNHIIPGPKSYYSYADNAKPDVWFDAVQVWEIKAADLSISPVYRAGVGLVDSSKGISLRFPRFIRIRNDKSPENATTSSQIANLYQMQAVINNNSKNDDDLE
ncbi:DNA ligase, ATP-dependent, central domain-containing protein [Rozella allomycis CSF55]|uniref:DNA ligase n=1 Tax=Rozella allomycis (strain CSF55) TaxID=988480 RepID=A0A075AMH4_ROZAC|nr:DNA ligase, ATP-dependent, central domain-containing protein [Rozella allomycis CSF55]|eukprot:EPZ30811.1 DNA ligase, ATP-dependent, central domain-containing protein [Rozella allomycis CSF55]